MTGAVAAAPGRPTFRRLALRYRLTRPFSALTQVVPSTTATMKVATRGVCVVRGGHEAHGTAQHLAAGAKWHLVDPG
jgi:hypothetical protein